MALASPPPVPPPPPDVVVPSPKSHAKDNGEPFAAREPLASNVTCSGAPPSSADAFSVATTCESPGGVTGGTSVPAASVAPAGPEPGSGGTHAAGAALQPLPVFRKTIACALPSSTSRSGRPSPSTSPNAGAVRVAVTGGSHAGACANVPFPVPRYTVMPPPAVPSARSGLPSPSTSASAGRDSSSPAAKSHAALRSHTG